MSYSVCDVFRRSKINSIFTVKKYAEINPIYLQYIYLIVFNVKLFFRSTWPTKCKRKTKLLSDGG